MYQPVNCYICLKMPQGRRKTPFSGKAKKEQLKAKKLAKGGDLEGM